MPFPLSNALGNRGACLWLLLALLSCVLPTSPALAAKRLLFDTPAAVSFDTEQLRLAISNIDHQWQLQLTPKRLLDNPSILSDALLDLPQFYDMMLSAHEISHNLGAEHDDAAACVSDNAINGSEIMWSELSGSTQPVFSSCSINQMQPALTGECIMDNIDVGVDLKAQARGDALPYGQYGRQRR